MSQDRTVSRPYAKAIFEIASQGNEFDKWKCCLGAVCLTDNEELRQYFRLPSSSLHAEDVLNVLKNIFGLISSEGQGELKELVLVDAVDLGVPERLESLIALLIRKNRLSLLPSISELFVDLVRDSNSVISVKLTTAAAITDEHMGVLKAKLSQSFEKSVEIDVIIQPDLIGGAVIKVGDTVFDGSVSGKLDAMRQAIMS